MKTIDVSEYGSNVNKTLLIHNIKSLESLKYNTGDTVTVIYFMNGDELHVNEPLMDIKHFINKVQ